MTDAIHFVGDACPGAHADQGSKLPLKEQHDIILRALASFLPETEAAGWLSRPHGELGGRPPRALLFADRFADVWRMVEELRASRSMMNQHAADILSWLETGGAAVVENAMAELLGEPPAGDTLAQARHMYARSLDVPEDAVTVRCDNDTTLRVFIAPAYREHAAEKLRAGYATDALPIERVRVSFSDEGEPKVTLYPLALPDVIAVDLKLDGAEITLDLEPKE